MADHDSTGSPLAAAAGAAGPDATEALGLLGNETRLAILLALWEAYDPRAGDDVVPFSALRERVGMRDSGQFNYHLDKLEGQFVEATDEGYRLRAAGLKVVQTIIGGAASEATLPPTEIDVACHLCGGPTAVTYRNGWLYHVCPECETGLFRDDETKPDGALFGEPFPAAALQNRSPEELFAAGVFRLKQVFGMKMGGLCPRCSGVVESTLDVCESHEPDPDGVCPDCGYVDDARVEWVCSVCKYHGGAPPSAAVAVHPEVVAFYGERGVEIGYPLNDFERSEQFLALLREHEQEVVSAAPSRVRVTISHGGDELRLLLDEDLDVVDGRERIGRRA